MLNAVITWPIANFSGFSDEYRIRSPSFGPPESQWQIVLFPRGLEDGARTHVALFVGAIRSTYEQEHPEWTRENTLFSVAIIKNKKPVKERAEKTTIKESTQDWGWKEFVPVASMTNETHLEDGCLTIRCKVKWSDRNALLSQNASNPLSLGSLLLSEWMADVHLVVRANSGTSTTFNAHRNILAARSTYFSAMFKSGFNEANTSPVVIQVSEFTPDDVKCMLEWIYVGKTTQDAKDTFENRSNLLRVADHYQLMDFFSYLSFLIAEKDLNLDSCFDVLEMAEQYSSMSTELVEACLDFVVRHIDHLIHTERFSTWSTETNSSNLKTVITRMCVLYDCFHKPKETSP